MSGAGHRRNMIYANHRKVNIGIARDNHNIRVVHHFDGDHVTFSVSPPIENGVLRFTGALEGDASMYPRRGIGVQVMRDPPTHPLTAGQLASTGFRTDETVAHAALALRLLTATAPASETSQTPFSASKICRAVRGRPRTASRRPPGACLGCPLVVTRPSLGSIETFDAASAVRTNEKVLLHGRRGGVVDSATPCHCVLRRVPTPRGPSTRITRPASRAGRARRSSRERRRIRTRARPGRRSPRGRRDPPARPTAHDRRI